MRKTIFSTLKLAAFAALLCAGCTDIGDEGMHGDENKRRAADSFLGLYSIVFSTAYRNDPSISGTLPAEMTVIPGDSITLPEDGNLKRSGRNHGGNEDYSYRFGGWNTQSNGSGTNYAAGSLYKPNDNVILFARWIRQYTVTFDVNGGSGGTVLAAITADSGTRVTLPSVDSLTRTRDNYYVDGWNTSYNGSGGNYAVGSVYPVNDYSYYNVRLYARWVSYRVEFNANGNTSGTAPNDIYIKSGDSITLPSGDGLTRLGYYFDGWNTSYNGNGTNYAAGSSYKPTDFIGYVDFYNTLYAKWSPQYRVEFYYESGTAPNDMWVMPGGSITLPSWDGLTRSGYRFDGWNMSSTRNGTNYAVGSSFKPDGNVILFAKWIPTYTVTFDVNGGSGGGTIPASITVDSGQTLTLPVGDSLTRSGYRFDGWNCSYNCLGTNYAAGSSYRPNSYNIDYNIEMVAKWIRQYTVTFNANGGTGTVPAAITADSASTVTLPYGSGLTRSGYHFVGWDADGQGTYNANSLYTVSGSNVNITLYAKWRED